MPRPPRFVRRLIALFTWSAREREMDQEMRFHVESIVREYRRAGMSQAEAERAARARFGNVRRLKERGHDIRTARGIEDLVRDLRHVARGLRKSPGFTLAVVLTLALGIGGNTAIFSVVDQLLLRPLPYPGGDQLLILYEFFQPGTGHGAFSTDRRRASVSPANWLDWQRESRTIKAFAAWRSSSFTLTGVGDPLRVNAQLVSAEFFPLLGVAPLLGRSISVTDDAPNAPRVVVISHRLWQTRFGGNASAIGRVVQLSDSPAEIVGVMPAGFRFIEQDTDVWAAIGLNRAQAWRETAGRFLHAVDRLEAGATLGRRGGRWKPSPSGWRRLTRSTRTRRSSSSRCATN